MGYVSRGIARVGGPRILLTIGGLDEEFTVVWANKAVPVIAGSFGLLAIGGTIVLTALLLSPLGVIMQVALVVIDFGLVGMVVGIGLVGLRTRQAQAAAAD